MYWCSIAHMHVIVGYTRSSMYPGFSNRDAKFILRLDQQAYVSLVEIIDIKKVDKQLMHAMIVKDRYANGTFIDKLTKYHQ